MNIEQRTHVGNVREINEDSYLVANNQLGHKLLLVADGMGGHNAGEIASSIATQIISDDFEAIKTEIDYNKFVSEVVSKANREIYAESLINPEYERMGTTLSFLIDTNKEIFIGHVGDSRIYYIKEDKIKQITKDHTIVQMLFETGQISKDEMETNPYRNVLLQSLGTNKSVAVDVTEIKIPSKGYILLCSDGLTEEVTDNQIHSILNLNLTLSQKADLLIKSALENDGKDNITLIIMERG